MKLLTYLQKTHQITRREFAEMLREQAIMINGIQVTGFDENLKIGDHLTIHLPDGEKFSHKIEGFPSLRPKLILFHKPVGYVVSKADRYNKTIFEILPPRRAQEYYYIGRLDKDSSGLLLLTNDTTLVDYYEHPSHKIHKVYEVQIDKALKSRDLQKMLKGVRVTPEGALVSRLPKDQLIELPESSGTRKSDRFSRGSSAHRTQKNNNGRVPSSEKPTLLPPTGSELLNAVSLRYTPDSKGKHWLVITLDQGKNRHIRRLLGAFDYRVLRLHRVKVGKRRLGTIRPGKWKVETKKLQ